MGWGGPGAATMRSTAISTAQEERELCGKGAAPVAWLYTRDPQERLMVVVIDTAMRDPSTVLHRPNAESQSLRRRVGFVDMMKDCKKKGGGEWIRIPREKQRGCG